MTAVASLTLVRVVVDHTMPTPPDHKVKDLALIFWSVSLLHQDFIFCQKHLEQTFFYVIFFTHIDLMRCFIVDGKSHSCNDSFTDVRFTSLLANKTGNVFWTRCRTSGWCKNYRKRPKIVTFLPRDAMHKRGLCRHAVSVCLSRSWIMWKRINNLQNFFNVV